MNAIGIDIGSTASKVLIRGEVEDYFVMPSGWNSKETAALILNRLVEKSIDVNSENTYVVATGYGRGTVNYANKVVTEITCHGMGGRYLAGGDTTIIDIGGQDTKIILVEDGVVVDFLMNDKCSAGTGKFLEIMANRLNITINELFSLAQIGTPIAISSLCTVFAESEIINFMQEGKSKEDIAAGIIDSVVNKVVSLAAKKTIGTKVMLTGGLSHSAYFAAELSAKLKVKVSNHTLGRFAGALGAALFAEREIIKGI
ncbi:MAG: acyl-CoA dehydratase activase [Velocimicrobium sp.]